MKAMMQKLTRRFTLHHLVCISAALAAVALAMVGWVERGFLPYAALGIAGAIMVELWVGVPLLRGIVVRRPTMPLEDFTVWMETGEPAAGLRELKPREVGAAAGMVSSSLGLLASNSELLTLRLSTLSGKRGFSELARSGIQLDAQELSGKIRKTIAKLGRGESWSPEELRPVLDELERCAAGYDRLANKLFEIHRERPEVIRSTAEPLRRAAERLSRDLRRACANIGDYAGQLAG